MTAYWIPTSKWENKTVHFKLVWYSIFGSQYSIWLVPGTSSQIILLNLFQHKLTYSYSSHSRINYAKNKFNNELGAWPDDRASFLIECFVNTNWDVRMKTKQMNIVSVICVNACALKRGTRKRKKRKEINTWFGKDYIRKYSMTGFPKPTPMFWCIMNICCCFIYIYIYHMYMLR